MITKWIAESFLILLLCIISSVFLANEDRVNAAQSSDDKVDAILLEKIATDGSADFIVRFTEQADLSPAYSMDWEERGSFVYETLKETAEKSQAKAKLLLDTHGFAYQTFIAGNELYVWGGSQAVETMQQSSRELSAINTIASLPEVSNIRATRTYTIDPLTQTASPGNIHWAGDYLANQLFTTVRSTRSATVDWGITDTKANQFWSAFGTKGVGIKVASIDTGVQWDHPALKKQFACPNDPTNPKCWFDPSNICGSKGACDNNGHGTHTMGTIVAKDDPSLSYIAGMSPNSTWIACKGCEGSSCTDFALNSCADWILAPGGNTHNRPKVVNNSWGGDGNDPWYLAKVQAWRAAGIFPAFSAGNSGPDCSTLGSPGDYQASFASAAHDSNRNIASFSSRGPSGYGDTPYTKPNISAPGVSICSTYPTNSWTCGYSGTSMASPHTAGAVALLWSCNPALIGQIDKTFQLLQNNTDTEPAGTCGKPADGEGNFTYGYGYLDVLKAGEITCANNRNYLPAVKK
jgi:subtilisin family serine protease